MSIAAAGFRYFHLEIGTELRCFQQSLCLSNWHVLTSRGPSVPSKRRYFLYLSSFKLGNVLQYVSTLFVNTTETVEEIEIFCVHSHGTMHYNECTVHLLFFAYTCIYWFLFKSSAHHAPHILFVSLIVLILLFKRPRYG